MGGPDEGLHEPPRTRELLARYLRGESSAERELFERHRAELVDAARRHPLMPALASSATPEDLVGDCLVRVLGSGALRRFEDRGRGSLAGFLATVLDRVVLDACRRTSAAKRDHGPRALDADGAGAAAAGSTPTSAARAEELLALCCAVLAPRDWELWRWIELDGLRSEDVAQRTGTTAAAVRSRMRRIRARLLRELSSPPGSA